MLWARAICAWMASCTCCFPVPSTPVFWGAVELCFFGGREGTREPQALRCVQRQLAPVRHDQRGELNVGQTQRCEISVQDGPGPLCSGEGLQTAHRSQHYRPRRDHLAIERIHRIEDLGLDRRARPLWRTLGQIQAKRNSGRNNQRNFLLLAGVVGLRRRRENGEMRKAQDKYTRSDEHGRWTPIDWFRGTAAVGLAVAHLCGGTQWPRGSIATGTPNRAAA